MLDDLSKFNPLDTIEKPVSPKFVAAICISVFMHAIFFMLNDFNAHSQPVSLPLHIVITQTKSTSQPASEPQPDIRKVIKPEVAETPEPRIIKAPQKQVIVKNKPRQKQITKKKLIAQPPPNVQSHPVAVAAHSEIEKAPVVETSVVLREVSYFHNPAPKYPSRARRMGLEGDLLIRARVLESGVAEEFVLKKSSGSSILDNAALKAVRNWQFIPAQRNDKTISTWVEIPIRFKLDT